MTRNEVIQELSKDKQYKGICRKIAGDTMLGDDLYSELMLSLFENKRLVEIREQCGRNFYLYVIQSAYNMFRNRRSKFNKMYRNHLEVTINEIPEIVDDEYILEIDVLHDKLTNKIMNVVDEYKGKFPYEVKMFEAYLEHKTLRALSRATGIPVVSCHTTIKKFKEKLKDGIDLSKHYRNSIDG